MAATGVLLQEAVGGGHQAIADAQPVNFSAIAAAQGDCPEVAEMMNSTTLQITTQAVGDETLLGDVPPARSHPT